METKGLYILIPAYNEEKTIEKVLRDLVKIKQKNKGLIKKIIVVNDGSVDRTGKVAEKYADRVIHLKKNMGKARAFWEGLKFCWGEKAKIMVTLDADLNGVSEVQLRRLTGPLETRKEPFGEIKMVIGERKGDLLYGLSGERAFLVGAFKALMLRRDLQDILLRGGRKKGGHKKRVGFGLEIFLNEFFKSCSLPMFTGFEVGPTTLEAGRSGRTVRDKKRFNAELSRMINIFSMRKQRLKEIRGLRLRLRKR